MTETPHGDIRFPARIAIDLEKMREGNGKLDPRTRAICDVGIMLYWVSSELWRIGELLEGLIGEVPVPDEASPIPGESTEESTDSGETGPVDADEERQE
jgi:hypothetical protein